MSHAFIIVALSPDNIRQHLPEPMKETPLATVSPETVAEAIRAAVDFQMRPFDENGECFADGSRWDWWDIGGRYSGRLLGQDVIQRSSLTTEAMDAAAEQRVRGWWPEYLADLEKRGQDSDIFKLLWELPEGATLESEIERAKAKRLSAYAFLKDRRWCEGERLGWFGGTAQTECEVKASAGGLEYEGRCITTDDETQAKIITWQEESDVWSARYFPRFILPLPPETFLVGVDYHV